MKQGILITAYKDIHQLKELISFFDAEYFNVYIHLDRKSKFSSVDFQFLKMPQVKLITDRFKVNWGGFNHLRSYLYLLDEALKDNETICYHLITGQDFPVKSIPYFQRFAMEQHRKPTDYMAYHDVPYKHWSQGGENRLRYYHLYDLFNVKKYKKQIRMFVRIQEKLVLKRGFSKGFPKLYGGSTYWTLSRETSQYVIDYTKNNPKFLNRFQYSFCAEELYFQTIILNSPYTSRLINDNLRYIDWSKGRGSTPVVLDSRELYVLTQGNYLFARKFDKSSDNLKKKIKETILQVN